MSHTESGVEADRPKERRRSSVELLRVPSIDERETVSDSRCRLHMAQFACKLLYVRSRLQAGLLRAQPRTPSPCAPQQPDAHHHASADDRAWWRLRRAVRPLSDPAGSCNRRARFRTQRTRFSTHMHASSRTHTYTNTEARARAHTHACVRLTILRIRLYVAACCTVAHGCAELQQCGALRYVISFIGLPARGKQLMARRLCRYVPHLWVIGNRAGKVGRLLNVMPQAISRCRRLGSQVSPLLSRRSLQGFRHLRRAARQSPILHPLRQAHRRMHARTQAPPPPRPPHTSCRQPCTAATRMGGRSV